MGEKDQELLRDREKVSSGSHPMSTSIFSMHTLRGEDLPKTP